MRHGISISETNSINTLNIKIMWQFSKMANSELVSWFIMFLNGVDWNDPEDCRDYEAACKEADKRGAEVQEEIAYLKEVI